MTTRKFLFRFRDGQEAETVYIPDPARGSRRGLPVVAGRLHAVLPVLPHRHATLDAQPGRAGDRRPVHGGARCVRRMAVPKGETPRLLSTIVLMGMGEPLYNYANVAKAMTIAMDGEGIGLSRRRITLSTSGVVPMMDRAGAELGVNLAVSLHAVRDDLRDELVPLNRKYPIEELIAACRRYPGASNARRITFEYVMLKGVNDSAADARELVRLIAGMPGEGQSDPVQSLAGVAYETSSDGGDRAVRRRS